MAFFGHTETRSDVLALQIPNMKMHRLQASSQHPRVAMEKSVNRSGKTAASDRPAGTIRGN